MVHKFIRQGTLEDMNVEGFHLEEGSSGRGRPQGLRSRSPTQLCSAARCTPIHWKGAKANPYRSQIDVLTRTERFDTLRSHGGASFDNVDQFGLVVAQYLHRVRVCPVPFVVVP